MTTRRPILIRGMLPGFLVSLYVPNALTPWTLMGSTAWLVALISASVFSTATASVCMRRLPIRFRGASAGIAIGVFVGTVTIPAEMLAVRLIRVDLLAETFTSGAFFGALTGGLAGAFLVFNRRWDRCMATPVGSIAASIDEPTK